ncbi:MAG: hypothetical protein L0Z70_01780 [Chloroflexi bacterium]|nr:hypothetical protein [Chloroflexota bacterium]
MAAKWKPGKAAPPITSSSAKRRAWLAVTALALTVVSCARGGYWLPPSAAQQTAAPAVEFLLQSPLPIPPTDSAGQPATQEAQPLVETPTPPPVNTAPYLYYSQAADTLSMVAVRFGVRPEEITSPEPIPAEDLLPPNQLLIIPRRLVNTASPQRLLPDSEVVYSPSAVDFDVGAYIQGAGGYLSGYDEWLQSTRMTPGSAVVKRVALENSINPRLLLALLEYQSGWVTGQPQGEAQRDYPLGHADPNKKGLYRQLVWAVNQLSVGYYNWREGRLLELQFSDGVSARLAPDLNAGTAALLYLFSQLYDSGEWLHVTDPENGFPALYEDLFGSPWLRAQVAEPLYLPGLEQPPLILPFDIDRLWSYTGGPHGAWEHDGSYAALDFAPGSSEPGCQESNAWVVASAAGKVVRYGGGVVVLDLDGDGYEQTGWVILYLHVTIDENHPPPEYVAAGDHLGHPSCEGGLATGTHVHIARKYNGEWIAADGPLPFTLSGWQAHAGEQAYLGSLTRGEETIEACVCGSFETRITRTVNDPYEEGL